MYKHMWVRLIRDDRTYLIFTDSYTLYKIWTNEDFFIEFEDIGDKLNFEKYITEVE